MTTIAYRDGILACDSRATVHTEDGGARFFNTEKLFRKVVTKTRREVIIATAGESAPSLVFVDWFGSGKQIPDQLLYLDSDFTCLILQEDGLYEADKFCRPEKVIEPFYAIGSGTKAALAAMHCGKSALEAVQIAALIDPGTAAPFKSMQLTK